MKGRYIANLEWDGGDIPKLQMRGYTKGRRVLSAPTDLLPTGIQLGPHVNNIWIDGYRPIQYVGRAQDDGNWFHDAAKRHSPEVFESVRNTFLFADIQIVKQALQEGNWVIVSDGSYSPITSKGTAAVVIEDALGKQLLKTYVLTPGKKEDISACRSELVGIYVGCLILKIFVQHLQLGNSKVVFGCDNEKAVSLGLLSNYFSPVTDKHCDVLWEIQSIVKSLSIKINATHVYEHQDFH